MRRLLAVVIFAALVALLVTRAEPFAPSVSLETPIDFVGRAGPAAIGRGGQVGDEFFPGVAGSCADAGLRVALFALPQSLPDARPAVLAADVAGNARRVDLGVKVTPRRFAEKTMPVTDDFLSRKVPELLAANDLDQSGDLVEGYLRINRELRAKTEVRVRQMCRDSAPAPLWQ